MVDRLAAEIVVLKVAARLVHVLTVLPFVPVYPVQMALTVPPVRVKLLGFFKPGQLGFCDITTEKPNRARQKRRNDLFMVRCFFYVSERCFLCSL